MPEVTLKDVAQKVGIHPATASRALDPRQSHLVNIDTRQRVEAAAAELGYKMNVLARSLRKGSSGLVGVVVADLGNPFVPILLRGIDEILGPKGYMTAVAETHENPEVLRSTCEQLVQRRVDGIVVSAAHLDDSEFIANLERSVPVVLAVRRVSGGGHYTAAHDDILGGRMATEYLVGLGHKRLAQLRGPDSVSSFVGRTRGFQEVLSENGYSEVTLKDLASEPTIAEGKRLAASMLARKGQLPTAIFAQNDSMAIGAYEALADAGLRCPHDVSIVGYNDTPMTAHLAPPLTTVKLPYLALGRRVAALLLGQLAETPEPPLTVQFEPELVIRSSAAGPARSVRPRRTA